MGLYYLPRLRDLARPPASHHGFASGEKACRCAACANVKLDLRSKLPGTVRDAGGISAFVWPDQRRPTSCMTLAEGLLANSRCLSTIFKSSLRVDMPLEFNQWVNLFADCSSSLNFLHNASVSSSGLAFPSKVPHCISLILVASKPGGL